MTVPLDFFQDDVRVFGVLNLGLAQSCSWHDTKHLA